MGRIYAIALNAFREAIRDRVLFAVLGLAAASLLVGTSLAWLSLAEQVRIVVDHGVVTMSWLSNMVAIFLGASFLYKEIELRTLYVILAKPVARWEFVLGKYLGIVATSVVFLALTASMLLGLLSLQAVESAGPPGSGWSWLLRQLSSSRGARALAIAALAITTLILGKAAARVPLLARAREALGAAIGVFSALALLGVTASVARAVAPTEVRYVLLSTLLVAGEVAVTGAVAVFFSSFSTPVVTGVLTLGVLLVGRSAGAILELRPRQMPLELRELLQGVATVVPNLHLFVPSRLTLLPHEEVASVPGYIANVLSHGALYAAILVAAAGLLFRRRDLT